MKSLKVLVQILVLSFFSSFCYLDGAKRTYIMFIFGPPRIHTKTINNDWYIKSKRVIKSLRRLALSKGHFLEIVPSQKVPSSFERRSFFKVNRYLLTKKNLLYFYRQDGDYSKESFVEALKSFLESLKSRLEERLIEIDIFNGDIYTFNRSEQANLSLADRKINFITYGLGTIFLDKVKPSLGEAIGSTIILKDDFSNFEDISNFITNGDYDTLPTKTEIIKPSRRKPTRARPVGAVPVGSDIIELESEDSSRKESIQGNLDQAKKYNIPEDFIIRMATELKKQNDNGGQTTINFNFNQQVEEAVEDEVWSVTSGCRGCSTKKFLGTTTAVLGIIITVAALL